MMFRGNNDNIKGTVLSGNIRTLYGAHQQLCACQVFHRNKSEQGMFSHDTVSSLYYLLMSTCQVALRREKKQHTPSPSSVEAKSS